MKNNWYKICNCSFRQPRQNTKMLLSQPQKVKVLLAATQNTFVNTFAGLFKRENDFQIGNIVAEKASIYQFVVNTQPNIAFFHGESSMEIIQQIKSNLSLSTRCVLVFQPSVETFLVQGIYTLADAYLIEHISKDEEYLQCIQKLILGERYISPIIIEKIVHNPTVSEYGGIIDKLGKKEYQVLRLMGYNYSIKKIAESLYISTNTVESHRNNIIKKLDVNDAKELRQLAAKMVYSYHKLVTDVLEVS